MGMANPHLSCPSSLLLLQVVSVGHRAPLSSCRPAPLEQSLEKRNSCAPLTQLPHLSRTTCLSQGYLAPFPHEWHSAGPMEQGRLALEPSGTSVH